MAAIPQDANQYVQDLTAAQAPAAVPGAAVAAAAVPPAGPPQPVRRLTGFRGAVQADGLRILYSNSTLDEGFYVREADILDHRQARKDADGLQADVLLVRRDAVIIRWSVEGRRLGPRGGGGGGVDDGNRT